MCNTDQIRPGNLITTRPPRTFADFANPFKAGDRVVYVGNTSKILTQYTEYTVSRVTGYLLGVEGSSLLYEYDAFELVGDKFNHHPHHDLIIAWAKGAEIEVFSTRYKEWYPATTPKWREGDKYRIKPTNPHAKEISHIRQDMDRLSKRLAELEK